MTTSARADRLCPTRRERFIASGMERTPIAVGGPYAYLVGAGDQWLDLPPHERDGARHAVERSTSSTRWTTSRANATNSRPLDVYFQDITGCGGSTYDVPGNGGPGSVHTKSRSWTAPWDGIAVFAGGHLHEGGIDITLKDATANQTAHRHGAGLPREPAAPRHDQPVPPPPQGHGWAQLLRDGAPTTPSRWRT